MTVSETAAPRRNGVDVGTLFAIIGAVRDQPALAFFQFRSHHEWVSGTHNRGTIDGFHGAGQEHRHVRPTIIDADHPAVLVGQDHGPTPAELLLHALGACLMSGLANIAAARGIDDAVRNGYQAIRVTFHVDGDAASEQLAALVTHSRSRSAVFDVVTNGVPVTLDVATA